MHIKSIKTETINNVDFMNILKYSHYNPTQREARINRKSI